MTRSDMCDIHVDYVPCFIFNTAHFMMDLRMLPIWRNVSETAVNKLLVNSIIDVFDSYQHKFMHLDFIWALNTLRESGLLPQEHCNRLLNTIQDQHLTKRQELFAFIVEITTLVQPREFFDILDLIGLSDLRELVHCEYSGPVHRQIHRAHIPSSKRLQSHFYKIKSHLDSADQAERNSFLSDDTNKLKASFDTAPNENELTTFANKFAVNTWLCVQQCNRNTGEIRRMLMDMRVHSWPPCVDPILSEIVYESKMAVVTAMEGSFDFAKIHRRNAKYLVREYCDPLTKSLVYHDSRYVSQMLSRNNVNDTTSVPKECETGLRFLESETNGSHFCILMQRSLLLFIAEYHLQIGNDFQIDRRSPVSANDFEKAKLVLYLVKENFQSRQIVEKRRDMVYCVCKARMHDIQHDYRTAIRYLREAETLSQSSAFFEQERNNIVMYISALQRA